MKRILSLSILLTTLSLNAQKLDTTLAGKITLIVNSDTLETFKTGNKRFVLINGKRRNIFRREPAEIGHYEYAKF